MPIANSEIQWFNPASVSDATPAQNGGRPSQTQNISGVKNNLFPDTTSAARAVGIEYWRKAFILVKSAGNSALLDPKISLERATPGDSHTLIYPGTWTDTEATRTGRPYGYGTLASAVAAGDIVLDVTTEADFSAMSDKPFQAGDLVRVDARADVLAEGLSEYVEISNLVYDGDALSITLAAPLANSYDAGVHVASAITPGDLASSVTDKSVTGGVTYDDTAYPVVVPQIGGIYQTWTITITDAATGELTVVGDTLGPVISGAQGVDLAPPNPNGGVYFTLAADGWGGAPSDGDTLMFTTAPAGCSVWYQRIIPAGSAAIDSDPVDLCIEGESA